MTRPVLLIALAGCSGGPREFPDGFLFGSATAGFQVEAGCPTLDAAECEDPASDWYQWVTDPDLVAEEGLHITGDPLSNGPGMWETFEDDADRMQSDGMNTFRMGIEWSRLFPDGAAEQALTVDALAEHADADAVARYHEMLDALRERDIEPMVTINHYTLPLWVHDGKTCHFTPDECTADGWLNRDRILRLIGLYAGFLAREYGEDVKLWATLNEPMAIPLAGYLAPGEDRSNPPGLFLDGARAKASLHHQIEGHAVMYDAVKAEDEDAEIGLVMNMAVITPKDDASAEAAERTDHLYHALFLDGVTAGSWDDDLDGTFEATRPDLAGRLDWVGINYYAEVTVTQLPFALVDEIPLTDVYPEIAWIPPDDGIYTVVERAAEYDLPMYVTENGLSSDDSDQRVDALRGVLSNLQRATADGYDVRGYYYWSFVDNYEWNHGTSTYFFGLYGLDPVTKERDPEPVLYRYRKIIANNGFSG